MIINTRNELRIAKQTEETILSRLTIQKQCNRCCKQWTSDDMMSSGNLDKTQKVIKVIAYLQIVLERHANLI